MIDYTHLRHQRRRKLLLPTIINVQSTFLPAILPNVHRFKKITDRLSNKFVKMWLGKFRYISNMKLHYLMIYR